MTATDDYTAVFRLTRRASSWTVPCIPPILLIALVAVWHIFARSKDKPSARQKKEREKQTRTCHLVPNKRPSNAFWNMFHGAPSTVSELSELSQHLDPANPNTDDKQPLRRRMTSIGRFALRSQTEFNPSIITLFVALANEKGKGDMAMNELEELWGRRVMDKHERFRCRVCKDDDRYFEIFDAPFQEYASEVSHPQSCNGDLRRRIKDFMTSHFDVTEKLWEASFSSGPIGSLGAISQDKVLELKNYCDNETVALFRVHHAIADGVSMSVALGDVADEAEELTDTIMYELDRRKRRAEQRSLFEKVWHSLEVLIFFICGTIKAVTHQLWRMFQCTNPFDRFISISENSAGSRSMTWRQAPDMAEAKKVAKSISPSATLNDLFMACTTAAIHKQLQEHCKNCAFDHPVSTNLGDKSKAVKLLPHPLNIVVPVHLSGGVLRPGDTLGNKIGAFVANVPLSIKEGTDRPASKRLIDVSVMLRKAKSSMAPLISWTVAKIFSDFAPEEFTKVAMRRQIARQLQSYPMSGASQSRFIGMVAASTTYRHSFHFHPEFR